jgi:hypothetical protein
MQPPINPAGVPPSQPVGFECPFCHSRLPPVIQNKVSTTGWVVLVVMLLFCFPLFWVGLLIKEDYRVCRSCGIKLG